MSDAVDPPRIRPATAADVAAITACVRAAYAHYVPRIGREPGPMQDDYARVVAEHEAYVAERDGRVAGVLVMIHRDDGTLLLDNIAVDPAFQGTGLGAALLDFAEARAVEQGYAQAHLYTHEKMHENIAWYARRGWQETHRVTEKGFARVYMRKMLPGGTG